MAVTGLSPAASIVTAAAEPRVSTRSPAASITTRPAGTVGSTGLSPAASIVTVGSLVRRRTATGSVLRNLLRRTATGSVPLISELGPGTPAGETPLGTLTVENFLPLSAQTTSQQWTFQTTANITVTRLMEYRPYTTAGTGAWTFAGSTVRTGTSPSTIHTATVGTSAAPLTPGVQYEARITLTAQGFTPLVLTWQTTGYSALRFTTLSTPAPVPTTPRLDFAPATLVEPLVIPVPVAGGSFGNLAGRDVRWVMPSTPVTGQLSVFGGRHHELIGGEFVAAQQMQACLKIEQYEGTVHVEGVVLDPTGGYGNSPEKDLIARPTGPPYLSDAIRTNSTLPDSHFQLQAFWAQVNGAYDDPATPADSNDGPHGDFMQNWSGPVRMSVARGTLQTWYQGFFCYVNQPGFAFANQGLVAGLYRFRDLNVWRHTSSGGARAWEVNGPTNIEVTNCYARRDPGSNTSIVASNSSNAEALWIVSETAPPGGDFQPKAGVGIGYTSPGYL